MSLRVVLGAVALLMLGVLAGWVWSAEQGEAPAEAAAPAEAEAAPAEAAPAEAEAEAEEAAETVKGWLCEIKMNRGRGRMRPGTMKLTATKMYREGVDGTNLTIIGDAEAGVTYEIATRVTQADPEAEEEFITRYKVDKFPWRGIDGQRRAMIDGAIQNARMGLRAIERADRLAAEKLVASLEAYKKPADLEATEETKTFGDYTCVKYTLTQGDRAEGVVWVTKDIEVDAPLGALLAHSAALGREGGLPFLLALDELDGFPLRVNLQYYVPGKRSLRRFNFWFEKVTEAEFELAEFEIPPEAEVTEPMSGRGSRPPEGSRRGREAPPPGTRR